MTCNHHKKSDSEIPAWLWFAIFPAGLHFSEQEKKDGEMLAKNIKKKLKEHLKQHGLENDIITEPNNYDSSPICDKCHHNE